MTTHPSSARTPRKPQKTPTARHRVHRPAARSLPTPSCQHACAKPVGPSGNAPAGDLGSLAAAHVSGVPARVSRPASFASRPSAGRGVIGPIAVSGRRPATVVYGTCRVRWRQRRRTALARLRGRLAVAGRRGVGVGRVAGLQPLGQQGLDPGRDRDRHQGADQSHGRCADQAGQQHGGGAELDWPAHDPRRDQVVLDLLEPEVTSAGLPGPECRPARMTRGRQQGTLRR
jgi:hypothetical protein